MQTDNPIHLARQAFIMRGDKRSGTLTANQPQKFSQHNICCRFIEIACGFICQNQLRTIGKALEGIMHVILFLALFFIFLSLIGLQLFSQEIYNACRLSKFPVVVDGEIAWPRATREDLPPGSICVENNKFTIGGFHCPPEYTCGNSFDSKYPMDDHTELSSQLYYNVFIWKHFGGSLLSVF